MIARLALERSPERSLRDAGLNPQRWSAGPHAVFAPHSHAHNKRLFVLRGRIRFNDEWLEAPDGIRIPAGFEHSAVAGDHGVECIEAFEERR